MERSSSRLFVSADAFGEHYMVPVVRGRDGQFVRLRQSLAPVFRGVKPLHVLLLGPPGTGKTLVARHVLKEISAKGLPTGYINCMEYSTLYAVLDKIICDHKILQSERISTAYKLNQIGRFLKDRPFVLTLDEIDRVPPKDRAQMLYSLTNFGKLGIVCIASNSHFLQSLDENVRSRLMPTVIEFPPYDVPDLKSIIQQRADIGLAKDTCRDEIAKELAMMAGGDARTAIQALKRAAVNAGQHDGYAIVSSDARSGWQNGAELKREYTLSLLNEHQRAVFRILQEFGEMTSARLWQEYKVECERVGLHVIAPRTFSHYMTKLEMAGLVEARKAHAKGNVRVFRVVSLKRDAVPDES